MAQSVAKDFSLFNDFCQTYKAGKYILTLTAGKDYEAANEVIALCNKVTQDSKNLSDEFCKNVIGIAKKLYAQDMQPWIENLSPALLAVAKKDVKYISECSRFLWDAKLSPKDERYFAGVYENLANKELQLEDGIDKSSSGTRLSDQEQKIKDGCRSLIIRANDVFKVKYSKKYPLLFQEITSDNPYVDMCIRNLENPEKESIGSLLNRLEAKEAKTFEDFQEAVDFVHRRNMCRFVCKKFNAKYRDADYSTGESTKVDEDRLSYDMAEVGIDNRRTAKRVVELFSQLNEKPAVHGSDYNIYYPDFLKPWAEMQKMQDWMYPVMIGAVEKGGLSISDGRMPSERTLFDCCKAWKICPEMPQKLAERVGRHSLYGRMLAGAIFDQMSEQGQTKPEEWLKNKNLHEKFFEELSRVETMDRAKALKQYIPNTAVNRKRLIGAGMEEKGIENTPRNFKTLYRQMREKGIFDKMLAKPGEAKTTFNSRLLVEVARRKQGKGK